MAFGQKIGVDKYYEYLEKFGFLNRTGIDLPGEANSIFLKKNKVGPVELATISFGQRFEVTPIQMLKMVGTIANKGKSITPRIVKAKINSKTSEKEDFEVKEGMQVISEETANKVLSMMGSVVEEGTGKNAKVPGYYIGGKTGTSEDGVNTGKYVTSFVGVANVDDPELVIIIILYNPTGEGGHQGGGVAAPIAGEVLSEVLPYMELKKEENEEDIKKEIQMPDVIGLPLTDAKKILKELNLEVEVDGEETNDQIVIDQLPKKSITVKEGSKVTLFINQEEL